MKRLVFILMLATAVFSGIVKSSNFGGRTGESIQLVFDGLVDNIFERFFKELELRPSLNETVLFKISILKNGRVANCESSKPHKEIQAMVIDICKIIENANFGEGDEFVLSYPINFLPE